MKITSVIAFVASGLVNVVCGDAVPFERLDRNNSVLLIVDVQVGLFQMVRDWDAALYRDNIMAHSELGKVFDLPVVMTSSAESGPNGPIPKEITDLYPNTTVIKRQGEVNAWDNAEFRDAVMKTGKKQVIVAGIVTDVCTTFLSLSLRAEGYTVFANVEGSGTTSTFIRDTSNARMQQAGVHLVSLFAIVGDLMRDWRSPGVAEVVPYLTRWLPIYGMLAQGHAAALGNGTAA